jgi:hypothetical protein
MLISTSPNRGLVIIYSTLGGFLAIYSWEIMMLTGRADIKPAMEALVI